MAIYAIGDLHLSFSVDKPMDVFGERWVNYVEKIRAAWLTTISDDDVVLLPGDTSWGINLTEAAADFKWLDDLPGKIIISRGNHDYWWATLTKMNPLYDSIEFIHNSHVVVGEWAVCGSRGWLTPGSEGFTEDDEKIYKRELHRLELSLSKAKRAGHENILVMLHYPPTNDKKEFSPIQALLEEYQVKHVVYGHLHTKYCWELSLIGDVNGIEYHMVSSDYLDFVPKLILE